MKLLNSVLLALIFLSPSAYAAYSPLSISIVPPVQFPSSDFSITGARVNLIYGHHRDVYGLDIGAIGNIVDQDIYGIQIAGIFNNTRGTSTFLGLQFAGIGNFNSAKTTVLGLQFAGIVNYQTTNSKVLGAQIALANKADHTNIYGIQAGLYNTALNVYGFQIGLVNRCKSLHGIQIGLLNFHHEGLFKVSPILNAGF